MAHDPTEVNRQGPDEGTSQYRTEIFAASPGQEAIGPRLYRLTGSSGPYLCRAQSPPRWGAPLKAFYAAEDYHQDYLFLNPDAAYIQVNDLPKIAALKRVWPDYYREKPVLLAQK